MFFRGYPGLGGLGALSARADTPSTHLRQGKIDPLRFGQVEAHEREVHLLRPPALEGGV